MNDNDRNLEWDGCHNVRDLGGLPTMDGGQTAWGAVVRADLLGRLTPRGRQQLLDYGVRTILDLRSPDQALEDPSAVFEDSENGPDYLLVQVNLEQPHVRALLKQAQTRAELTITMLDYYQAAHVRAMRAVAGAKPGGLVFHCHSGKDRTGTIAALLLSLAGVTEEAIAADYAATQERLWPQYQKWLDETGGEEEVSRWFIPITKPQTMLELLAHLREEYGGAEAYLLQAGLAPMEIERLRALLTA